MTPEERIAQLEDELALERAKTHELSAALAVAVQRTAEADAARARKEETEATAKALRRERNRRYRDGLKMEARRAQDVSAASPETSQSPSPLLDGSPLSSKPSLPSPLSSPQPLSASQGTASPSPDFELTSPTSKKRNRKPSEAEGLYETLEATRRQRCDEVGEEFIAENWPHARINRDIGAVLRKPENERARFESAWGLYLGDDGMRAKTPAWSLSYFMSSGVRAKYETMAAREEAA